MNDLDTSYALCQRLARQSASNFYYSFLLLPRAKRRAMCALYAYLRCVDDLGDDDRNDLAARRLAVTQWRLRLADALAGEKADPILPALADTVSRHKIPPAYLTAVLDGIEMDLDGRRYETFADLECYCQRVASVVGLACIHIWGFRGSEALARAGQCGMAFQLTNILRDLKEDAQRGRIYLPMEDLRRFEYAPEQLLRCEVNDRLIALMRFQISRAESFYAAAEELEPLLAPGGRRVFRAMFTTYHRLLEKIRRQPGLVFRQRIKLGRWEKMRVAGTAMFSRSRSLGLRSTWETASP